MEVTIDRDGCIACGLCAGTCPEVFAIADDGLAAVIAQPADAAQQDGARQAEEGCPVHVIHIA